MENFLFCAVQIKVEVFQGKHYIQPLKALPTQKSPQKLYFLTDVLKVTRSFGKL